MSAKLTFKLVRSFGLGFTVYAPSLNGFCFDINIACFSILFWNRGQSLIALENYWNTP